MRTAHCSPCNFACTCSHSIKRLIRSGDWCSSETVTTHGAAVCEHANSESAGRIPCLQRGQPQKAVPPKALINKYLISFTFWLSDVSEWLCLWACFVARVLWAAIRILFYQNVHFERGCFVQSNPHCERVPGILAIGGLVNGSAMHCSSAAPAIGLICWSFSAVAAPFVSDGL